MEYYAGIGSRKTPIDIIKIMEVAGYQLAAHGLGLRSGGAPGADTAFITGAEEHDPESIQNFLPWNGFNGFRSDYHAPEPKAFYIAEQFHPAWDKLTPAIKGLMARNSYQVLGPGLDDPSKFILCWTPNGNGSGGTGQALRIARAHGIPIFDLGSVSPVDAQMGIERLLT